MRFGIVGLGKIGGNLAHQALEKGHEVIGFSQSGASELEQAGAQVVDSLEALTERLEVPRVAIAYVPAGEPTESVVSALGDRFEAGDLVIDGGNSHWQDSVRRHGEMAVRGVRFLDCGTSGGLPGARHGACFMAGGEPEAYEMVRPLLEDLAVSPAGALHAGPPGAGHFAKLMHNMIEFGMVQAIGEGVELLMRSDYELDLPKLFTTWNNGSVIRSWLVELMAEAFERHGDLGAIESVVDDTGEQVWGVEYAMQKEVPIPLLAQAVWGFYESRDPDRPWAKAVAAIRHGYGGHPLVER